jgi:hypothetical protein
MAAMAPYAARRIVIKARYNPEGVFAAPSASLIFPERAARLRPQQERTMHIAPKFLRPSSYRKPPPPPAEPKPRPEISAPFNPRPYGMPIITGPINPRPFGLPDPNAGARRNPPEPVGPNAYHGLVERDPANADKYSPNYPVQYEYPFPTDGTRGLPTVTTGPSLLHAEYHVDGPVDYANVIDVTIKPDPRVAGETPGLYRSTSVSRYLPGGAAPDADGSPTSPKRLESLSPPKLPPTPENPFGLPGPDKGPDLMRSVLGEE